MKNKRGKTMKRAFAKTAFRMKPVATGFKEKWQLLLSCAFFVIGVIAGCTASGTYGDGTSGALDIIINGFISLKSDETMAQTFFSSLGSTVPLMLVVFILGFCALGIPLISLSAAFRGIGIGAMLGYMYAFYGVKGISYCLLLVIPPALLSIPAIILACKEAMRFSGIVFSFISKTNGRNDKFPDMRKYCLRFVVFLLALIAAALVDCLFTLLFGRFFLF